VLRFPESFSGRPGGDGGFGGFTTAVGLPGFTGAGLEKLTSGSSKSLSGNVSLSVILSKDKTSFCSTDWPWLSRLSSSGDPARKTHASSEDFALLPDTHALFSLGQKEPATLRIKIVIVHDPWIMGKDQLDGGMSFDLRGIEDRHGAPALFDALVEIQILPRIRLQLFDLVRPKHSELPGIGSLPTSSQRMLRRALSFRSTRLP